jgi:predicted NAD/FAD-dependent oxidoreductase
MDEAGRVVAAAGRNAEAHHVATPGMNALLQHWAAPIEAMHSQSLVTRIEPDRLQKTRWQLHTEGPGAQTQIHAGFDAVLLALPSIQATTLLRASQLHPELQKKLDLVRVAPCWTLMLAFPQAAGAPLGPSWHAARSEHHRIAWLAREGTKPGRESIERWTVQASPQWSQRHLEDDEERVKAKLLRAFTEVTGIRAEPGHAQVHRWRYAQTLAPLGQSHLWDGRSGIGLCGDWCLGRRVEDAFVSGLELALHAA